MIMWNFCWSEPSRMTLLVAPIFMLPCVLVGHWEVWLGSRQLGLFCNEKCQVSSIKTFTKIFEKWFRV